MVLRIDVVSIRIAKLNVYLFAPTTDSHAHDPGCKKLRNQTRFSELSRRNFVTVLLNFRVL